MSGVKRTRTDEISSSQSQTTTTTNATISPKIEIVSSFNSVVEEDYN
ncbi:unnamed protein product, partial [Rotaria sp. Silwood2]